MQTPGAEVPQQAPVPELPPDWPPPIRPESLKGDVVREVALEAAARRGAATAPQGVPRFRWLRKLPFLRT